MKLYAWSIDGRIQYFESAGPVICQDGQTARFIGAIPVEETGKGKDIVQLNWDSNVKLLTLFYRNVEEFWNSGKGLESLIDLQRQKSNLNKPECQHAFCTMPLCKCHIRPDGSRQCQKCNEWIPAPKKEGTPIGIAKRDIAEDELLAIEIDFGKQSVSCEAIDFTQEGSKVLIDKLFPQSKKTVTKEAKRWGLEMQTTELPGGRFKVRNPDGEVVVFVVDPNAKNIKCTYEVEE
jgi:hypothetical protein